MVLVANGTPEPYYGRRVLVNLVDEIAASEPSRPFIFAPRSNEPEDGWTPITFKQFANAIHHVAHLVASTVKSDPGETEDFPTVAYVGPNDVRYAVVMLASVKAGCKALFISPRNSHEAQLSLFKRTNCKHIWYPASFQGTVEPWIRGLSMNCTVVPPADEWLKSQPEPFPYTREFEEARFDPLVVLHTSGTTGIPKPIVVRQGSAAIADGFRDLPDHQGAGFTFSEGTSRANKLFMPMPLFHAAGILGFIAIFSVYYGLPMVLAIPDKPLTPELAIKCIELSGVDAALLPPFIMEELAKSEHGLDVLKKLNYVMFGGGNLSRTAGEKLVQRGVFINNVISSTELVPYAIFFQPNLDLWNYFIFNSEAMGADWRCRDEAEGIFELVIRRKDPRDAGDQPCFYTFPDLDEWTTGDLYKAHPSLPDHWMYCGRADDIIVFSNGEKLNPVTIEETLAGHPAIKGAVVGGQDRFQPALILEPTEPPKDKAAEEALINGVWPLMEEINAMTVAHGRIVRRLVMVADVEKPFPRSGKGSIQRGLALKAYNEEIDALYERADEVDEEDAAPLDFSTSDATTQSIIHMMGDKIGVKDVKSDTDFFSLGVDSLQVMTISKVLRSSFAVVGVDIGADSLAPRVVYANPTAELLAGYLRSLALDGGDHVQDEIARELKTFNALVSKYTNDLPDPRPGKPAPLDEGQTVLLTGTTGSLGAYLLDGLCTNPHVSKIVALNRGGDGGKSRQAGVSSSRGLGCDFSKVEFLSADLSLPDLGLGSAKYDELLSAADRFIHNAWPVNFNVSIASLEPNIRGVRHLVDFSSRAAKSVPIVFLSSIGTVMGWRSAEQVPEQRLDEFGLAEMGYGRSKLAGSRILDAAVAHSAIPAATVRVGQIAGPKGRKGVWNRQEFIPSLIASSLYLGMLPRQLGPGDEVDWMPIEDVAGLILDVSGVTVKTPVSGISGYFHCVNPIQASWEDLASVVQSIYSGRITKLVGLEEWVAALEKSAADSKNPGQKLLDTYKGTMQASQAGLPHVHLAVGRTIAQSPTLARVGPVTPELLRNWCAQWDF